MKRFLIFAWTLLSTFVIQAAPTGNPSFANFNTNQFSTTGRQVSLLSGAVVTNLTFNSFTICDPGTTNCTTYIWPLTNGLSGQFLTTWTNGTNSHLAWTNLPVATVVFDTIEELVATPIPLPGIGLLAYVRDPLRGGPLAFYPNSVDTTNRFDTYASLDGPGNWKRPPDPNVYPQHGVVTGGVVTNETLVAALVLQSARAVGKVVLSGTDEFLYTDDVPLLDNNVLYGEDGAQATGLNLSANGKTNVAVYGISHIAAVADPSVGAYHLTNSTVLIQSPKFVGYSGNPVANSGSSVRIFTFDTSGFVLQAGNGLTNLVISDASGYAGLGTKFLSDDGTFQAISGAGTVANPTAQVGLTAVNGVATSAIRSDGAPALSQAIVPTWSGVHKWTNSVDEGPYIPLTIYNSGISNPTDGTSVGIDFNLFDGVSEYTAASLGAFVDAAGIPNYDDAVVFLNIRIGGVMSGGFGMGANTFTVYSKTLTSGTHLPLVDATSDLGDGASSRFRDIYHSGSYRNYRGNLVNNQALRIYSSATNVWNLLPEITGSADGNISLNLQSLGTGTVQVNGVPIGSGSVATDAIWDAKGDLAGGTGANTAARLAVGSNGQVLTANSAEATGLEWTTVAGTGDFVGPGDSADTEVVLFDGATGKLGKRSVVKIGSAGAVTGVESISVTNSVQADGFFTGSGSFDAAGLLPGVNIDMESNDIVGVDALIFDNSATLTGNVAVSIPSLIVTNAVIAGGFTNTATAFASGHWNATEFYPDGPINMDGFDIDMVSGTLLMDSGDITLVDDLVFDVGGSITGDASLALPSAVITNALTAGTLGVDGTSTFGAQASANSIWITNSVDRSIRTLTTTTPTLDLSLEGHQYITLSGNTTVTLANSPSGTKQRAVYLHVLGDAARTIAFAGVTVNWLTAQHSPPPATWIAYRFEWDGNEVQGATEAPLLVSELPTSALVQTIGITVDGGGSTITAGQKGYIEVPYACTINRVTMLADQSGSIVIDIWKDTYANYPPTVADTITASAKPTITTAVKSQDATLTGWTTSVAAGDVLGFNVDSASTITRLTLTLKVTKN